MKIINYGHHFKAVTPVTAPAVLYNSSIARAELREIYEAGYDCPRIVQPTYDATTATWDMVFDIAQIALEFPFTKVMIGLTGSRSGSPFITAAKYTAFSNYATTTFAARAQAINDPRLCVITGNEEANQSTDLTLTTLRSNLRSTATAMQAAYTVGDVYYVEIAAERTNWSSEGKGDFDRLGFNVYYDFSPNTGAFNGAIKQLVTLFGTANVFVAEWGIDDGVVAGFNAATAYGFANAERNFANNMCERQRYLEEQGLDHGVFAYRAGSFGTPTDGRWDLRDHKAWYALTKTRQY